MQETDPSTTIFKEIVINASPQKIFDALTEPEQLVQWWGDEEMYRCTQMECDLRVGGKWRTTGVSANGEPFAVEGIYRAVEPPHLLEYTWNYDWGRDPGETIVRFELTELGGATIVRVTHSGFTDPVSREAHKHGWDRVLGWLDGYVVRSSSIR